MSRTVTLKNKWSAQEGATNSTCSAEAHDIYALAEEMENGLRNLLEAVGAYMEPVGGQRELHVVTQNLINAISASKNILTPVRLRRHEKLSAQGIKPRQLLNQLRDRDDL